jgi:hypothetical protein
MPEMVPIDAAGRAAVLDGMLARIRERYVFPELAERIEADLRRRQREGAYDGVDDAEAFCRAVTADMHVVVPDKHLALDFSAEPQQLSRTWGADPAWWEEWRTGHRLGNYGVARVERLSGSVGYVDFRSFPPPDIGGDTTAAAMGFVAHCSALILDLRNSVGGSDDMVVLRASYLFDKPVHLETIVYPYRKQERQHWTLAYVAGPRFGGGKPLYVLTGPTTFSAAEMLAYDLQALKRAKVVGEPTAGAAHPTDGGWLTPHIGVSVPVARPVNPVTGGDWEGAGVQPDVAVPAERALARAHAEALRDVLAGLGETPSGPYACLAEEARSALAALPTPEPGRP